MKTLHNHLDFSQAIYKYYLGACFIMGVAVQEGFVGEMPPIMIAPVRDGDAKPAFPSFNPRTVDPDFLRANVPGEVQEFAFKTLIRAGDIAALKRLRPDMEWDRELTTYEIGFTDVLHRLVQQKEPIVEQPMGAQNAYGMTKTYINGTENQFVRKAEDERLRYQSLNGALHYSHEWIGNFPPAIRYRRLLERQVQLEIREEAVAAQRAEQLVALQKADEADAKIRENRRVAEIRAALSVIETEIDGAAVAA